MMGLWLWATVDGVGSARQFDKLCQGHLAYRWLVRRGIDEVPHASSDFRVAHGERCWSSCWRRWRYASLVAGRGGCRSMCWGRTG